MYLIRLSASDMIRGRWDRPADHIILHIYMVRCISLYQCKTMNVCYYFFAAFTFALLPQLHNSEPLVGLQHPSSLHLSNKWFQSHLLSLERLCNNYSETTKSSLAVSFSGLPVESQDSKGHPCHLLWFRPLKSRMPLDSKFFKFSLSPSNLNGRAQKEAKFCLTFLQHFAMYSQHRD